MDELTALVMTKTGLSSGMARLAVETVLGFIQDESRPSLGVQPRSTRNNGGGWRGWNASRRGRSEAVSDLQRGMEPSRTRVKSEERMAIPIGKLCGVTPDIEVKLKAIGIKRTDSLLVLCRTRADRSNLARRLGIEGETVQRLADRADLSRIRGIGSIYVRLLESVGVTSVVELAACQPYELRERLGEMGLQQNVVGRVPSLAMVRGWITKANSLPPAIEI